MRRNGVLGAVVLAAMVGTMVTACEPAPLRPVFYAVGTEAGPDALPGDGLCATASGGCSLQAAIEEANTVPRARIMATGDHPDTTLAVTGDLELWALDDVWSNASGSELTVAQGAVLKLRDMSVGSLTVDGSVVAERVGFGFDVTTRPQPPAIDVGPTGAMLAVKVDVMGWTQVAVRNQGRLVLRYATIRSQTVDSAPVEAAITTSGAGSTTLGATHLLGSDEVGMVDACAGTPPVSEGWNVSYDSTCGLTGPGDRQDLAVIDGDPVPGSPLVDAVPLGSLGCQAEPSDSFGAIGAADGDEDGLLACDIGLGYER